jgi:ketosteroid isomerase-like protein
MGGGRRVKDRLGEWLRQFAALLEARDAPGVAALFTEEAEYFETPFAPPLNGRAAIRESVARFAASQTNVRFEYELLCSEAGRGIVWWRLSSCAMTTGHEVDVNGIFLFWLNRYGQCPLYQEWWHTRERAPDESMVPEMGFGPRSPAAAGGEVAQR